MAVEQQTLWGGIRRETADAGMAVVVIGILMAMLLPLPRVMLDLFLALNITIAIIVLITAMYATSPLEFSIFPSLLLMLTLFRLSLNVASTRLILLHGNEGPQAAGAIIQSFGSFVVGGNYVVGLIIFVILVLVNFAVIVKGAGRIAEVAARFTLDGMPGKQMAIDADLNAGIIDEIEAKQRRKDVAREAEFHGAMDGASKFVKGDAIAGIVITLINICGGFIIGKFQMGLPLEAAAQNYTLLTIGDGLVSQIPALVISTSAGILVSRAGSMDRMGKEYGAHFLKMRSPIYIGAFIIFLVGIVPGLPFIPFTVLALLSSGTAFFFGRSVKAEEEAAAAEAAEETRAQGPEEVEHLLSLDTLELEVGYGLIPFVDKEQNGTLLDRIRSIRRQFASEMGIIIPPIHIRDNMQLKPSQYRMLIKGVEVERGELMLNHLLAMDSGTGTTGKIDGVPTTEPAFHLPALWIPLDKEDEAKFAGYTVVDNTTVVATHLTEILRNNAADLLGRQEVQHLLDNLSRTSPKAVEELVPNLLTVGAVQKVLQNLLSERVSIRDLGTIVETLADYATVSRSPEFLTEQVRQKLSRSILDPYIQPGNILQVIMVSPETDDMLAKGIQQTDHGSYLSVSPKTLDAVMGSLKKEIQKTMEANIQPAVLCSVPLRRHLRDLVRQVAPSVMVFSHPEIPPNVKIQSTGSV
ncbi:MAG: flagellar biosynthesis protein FlhA [Thermodesulfobacteriota bacterium]|nr:flagellar biosynthesis protein FlhA [Thermodesulfobacteriota bacterium]